MSALNVRGVKTLEETPPAAHPGVLGAGRPRAPIFLRTAKAYREGGTPHLLMVGLRKVIAPLVDAGYLAFFARELDDTLPSPEGPSEITVRWAWPAEIDRLVAGYDGARSAEALRERFRRQDRCIAAFDDRGEIAHCRWIATRRANIPEFGMDLVLTPGEAYFYDGYTRREARGRGIDAAVRSFIFHQLRADGFHRVYSYVRGDNPIGMKAARRRQLPVQTLWYIRLRGLPPLVIGKRILGHSRFVTVGIAQERPAAASAGGN